MKMLRMLVVGLLALLAFRLLPLEYLPSAPQNELVSQTEDYGSLYNVVRVVDGDTIVADVEGKEVKVRLIGVNTPESVHEDETKNVPEGKDASAYMNTLLKGRKIYLVYDEDREDDYGRTLAYVFTEEFEFVNLLLVEEGLAECMKIEPNTKYADVFEGAEKTAKAENKGFWGLNGFPN